MAEKEERCELTGLIVGQCACKNCRPDLKEVVLGGGQPFIAAFDSSNGCACGNEIHEGDEVGYIDGELACIDCLTAEKKKDTKRFTRKWRGR